MCFDRINTIICSASQPHMPIFKINNGKLTQISNRPFSDNFEKEKKLQNLIENNLSSVFGLEFVSTEFSLESFSLDSLAFDPRARSFVILEYKKVENFSLMDQGKTYLNLALEHKDSLLQEYLEKTGKTLKRTDIDWSQTRVLFIGPEFTVYQKRALSPDLPFELWEIKVFDENIISFNPVLPVQKSVSKYKTKPILEGQAAKDIKTYTIEQHYNKAGQEVTILLNEIRERIKAIDSQIIEKPVGYYIGYKASWYNFVSVSVYKDKLGVTVRKTKLEKDFKNLFKKIPESYKWGKTPLWRIEVKSDKTIDYIMPIIKESYEAAPDK